MIELRNVAYRYPAFTRRRSEALKNVSAHLVAGAVHGIAGPNGAGKSTFVSICLGFLTPDSGSVTIDEKPAGDYVRTFGAGLAPDEVTLPRNWTPRSALRRFHSLYGPASGGTAIDVDAVLEEWGLTAVASASIASLSRGTQQRVVLAQAFMGNPAVVVLDEPSNALDFIWRAELREAVRRASARNATVIVSSHNLDEMERIADNLIVLDRGRVTTTLQKPFVTDGSDRLEERVRAILMANPA
jgi:ABC-2 type transport system ATP-binding protein